MRRSSRVPPRQSFFHTATRVEPLSAMDAPSDVAELRDALATRSSLQIVYFTAAWCGPCKRIAPHLRACATKHDAQVLRVDIDEFDPEYLEEQQIRSVPTFVLYKVNTKLARVNGAAAEPLAETIAKFASWAPPRDAQGAAVARRETEPAEFRPASAPI